MNSICIIDFCGRDSTLGESVDFSADYFPAEKVVKFRGCWAGIPNMPYHKEPSEQKVYDWVHSHPNWYEKRRAKASEKKEKRDKFFRDMDKYYAKNGFNVIHCIIALPDGKNIIAKHGCGKMDWLSMLQAAKMLLNKNPLSKISYFRHYEGVFDVEKFIKGLA